MRQPSALPALLLRVATLLVAGATLLAGCGGSGGTDPSAASRPEPTSSEVAGTITVFAAASLQEAFTALGTAFQDAHPRTRVVFSFGPSSGLAQQIGQGAPADVFASASAATMDVVVEAGDAAAPTVFAANRMEIAVPPDNPAGITGVADLAKRSVKVAVCQAEVPCGATALQVFRNATITVTPVTQEVDVKATLSKVRLGEVDAGVVYATDVRAAGTAVTGIEIPDNVNAATSYPIATLTGSGNATTAQAFLDLVRSKQGRDVLTQAGFTAPTAPLPRP